MKPLAQYQRMAERHLGELRPKMIAELASTERHHELLLEAEEKTDAESHQIRRQLIQ